MVITCDNLSQNTLYFERIKQNRAWSREGSNQENKREFEVEPGAKIAGGGPL